MKALVVERGDRVTIVAPYVAAFVKEIQGLPFRNRTWDDDLRAWTVRGPQYMDDAVALASKHFELLFVKPSDA